MPCARKASVFVVACLAAAGCGGGGSNGSTPTAPTQTAATSNVVTITISGQSGIQSFAPNPATAAGQMVVFRNADTVAHRVVLNDASLDTGDIAPGATSRAILMPAAGTNYHCSLHTAMVGAISAPNQAPPPCTGDYCSPTGY
jgi:plastocyanin